ncbi:hypothetical protein BGZ65_006190, partial [Modicella reniformis]
VETYSMSNKDRERADYYPKYMYYHASEEDAAKFHLKYATTNVSNLSAENRFLAETSASSMQETKRTINDDIMALGKDMVKRSRRQDEELAELKGLVKELMSELRSKNTPS